MSEARPLDLNYGHFGEPSYDSENHEWHFPRQPGRTRELKLIGQPVRALQSPLLGRTAHIQSATERAQNIKDITHQYPELLPASSLLPALAQVSEVVEDVTSSHDPTVSELLAFGEAVDLDNIGHRSEKVPIAAVAGGDAGEAVRLVLLNHEKLGWEGSKNLRLSAFSAKGGEEGWWSGNGSPIQQLVFGEAEGRPSSWLAVRCHGAVSVLRPQLRRTADMLPFAHAASNHNPSSRLNVNHIVTLPIHQVNDAPYSDIAFNPWYNQQIATVDQKGGWALWDIEKKEKQARGKKSWTVQKIRDGGLLGGLPEGETLTSSVADGWGTVLWAGDLSTIVVARRRMLAVYGIAGKPRRLVAPSLVSTTTSEWILDVKRSSKDSTHVFVITTFSIFWLQIAGSAGNRKGEEVAAGAKCLLSWRHFRDPEDISLRLRVAEDSESGDRDDDRETTLVLLYSRLTGLANAFTFRYARSLSNLAPSASDPYLLPLPKDGPDIMASRANHHGSHRSSRISAIILKAIKYESPKGSMVSGLGQTYLENDVAFYQLSLLTNDLALSECLYAEVQTDFKAELYPPKKISRSEIARTPAKVFSDFFVPNGFVDGDYEDSPHNGTAEKDSDVESRANLAISKEDPCTLNFEWLENEIHSTLTEAPPAAAFHEVLDLLRNEVEDKAALGVPTMETLLRIVNASVSVLDLDKASGDFIDFLDDIKQLTSEYESGKNTDEERQLMVSTILTLTLRAGLGIRNTAELSSIYETLIQTWIVPLSRRIPGRVRIALEKLLRDMAGNICLASYAMHIGSGTRSKDDEDQTQSLEAGARFVLPVRRRTSATSLGKGKERSDAVPSPPSASSQMSEDAGFMPLSAFAALPTPEPTPSLRSRSSVSSLAGSEDPASQRLRVYASLTPQPALPEKLANLLGHWQVGGDPAKYDWEAAQQATVTEDESEYDSQGRQRRRAEKRPKRQRENTVGPTSQPTPKRLGGSQPQQGQDTQDMQGSSQQTERVVTMSQVESGKFGGRPAKNRKMKVKARPAGFK
ncbi:hypothetical protein HO133_010774 [Letharia lupina]|uniref:RNA polymerase I-specific transcription initiation factor RRN6-like protein n=1 Tax=Letharia lupina TaxID=560253 RepID=A0A8H6CJ77_9LECA|nr:uncharacterized protein HO133_010774 [Letharia lupina]KAF6224199.1 hypothetical protein HO133_010774 [Letharia lupina]